MFYPNFPIDGYNPLKTTILQNEVTEYIFPLKKLKIQW